MSVGSSRGEFLCFNLWSVVVAGGQSELPGWNFLRKTPVQLAAEESTEVALGLTPVPPLGPTEKYHHRDLRWGVPLLGFDSKNIIIGGGSVVGGYPRRARGVRKISSSGGGSAWGVAPNDTPIIQKT